MARHAPPSPVRVWLARVAGWRPRPRTLALAAAALVVSVVAALVVAPKPHVDADPPARPATTMRAEGTRGLPRYSTAVVPSIGDPGKWTPPDERTTSSASSSRSRTSTAKTSPPARPTTTAPASTTSEPPPAPAAEGPVDPQPAAGAPLVELVNRDRLTAGCGPVALSGSLVDQSQAWSEQQARDDTMHHSPGVSGFGTWGENVAVGYETAAAVHDAWMASPGHRANILDCDFTLIGYGAADGTSGRYWTEQFAA
jgi:uncharacterized protein YkwD